MIRINLLPFRAAKRRENIKRQLTIFALSVLCTFVIVAYFFLNLSGKLSDLNAEESKIKSELATYEKTIKEINKLEKQIKSLNQKLDVIKSLEKNKTGPVRLLDEISKAVPKDQLWLLSMSESKGRLNLRGTARDNDTIALFMTNLEKSKYLRDVDLKTSKLKRLRGQNLNDFSLSCKTFAFPEPKETPKKKKGRKKK